MENVRKGTTKAGTATELARSVISIAAAIDQQRLVAPAEQMAKLLVPPIEPSRVSSQPPLARRFWACRHG